MVNMFYHYPVMTTIWSNVNRQEQNVVAYQKVEEVLVALREGQTSFLFPSLKTGPIPNSTLLMGCCRCCRTT